MDQEGLKVRRHVQEWKRCIESGELGYLLVDEEDDQGGKRREADVEVDGHLQVVGQVYHVDHCRRVYHDKLTMTVTV